MQSLWLYLLIVACEVAFWLVLALGLAVRYVLRRERASRWLLRALPLIDLALLVFTALDLASGTPAAFAHGLAAVYVGFTVAFGGVAVRWADARFAHRFAGGPPPASARSGWKAVRWEFELWLRSIAAWIIALGLIETLAAFAGSDATTHALRAWYGYGAASVFFWFVFGPAWSVVFFRRAPRDDAS